MVDGLVDDGLRSLTQIADELSIRRWVAVYVVEQMGLTPVGKRGRSPVFDEAAVNRIRRAFPLRQIRSFLRARAETLAELDVQLALLGARPEKGAAPEDVARARELLEAVETFDAAEREFVAVAIERGAK